MKGFSYTYKAHPTVFRGVQFRSRLEATWASMFHMMGWEWQYEPVDLNGWSPDFFVRTRAPFSVHFSDTFMVEVKPVRSLDNIEDACWDCAATLEDVRYEWTSAFLLLGCGPQITEDGVWLGTILHSTNGGGYKGNFPDGISADVEFWKHLWATACKSVQWKPR